MSKAKPTHYIDITEPEALVRLGENTIKLLKETKIPKHAFVVYEKPKLRYEDGKSTYTTSIVVVNVEDQPGQIYTLTNIENTYGKYCCHGNFPTHDDKDPVRAKKWLLYSDGQGSNPWDELAAYCYKQLGLATEISHETRKFKEEIEALKKQIKSEKKEGGANESTQGSR